MSDPKVEDKGTHEVIEPPSSLASKLTVTGAQALNADAFAKADQVIDDMAVLYADQAREDLARLQAAFDDLKADAAHTPDKLKTVFRAALDMKGQGASFGYDLISAVGGELCRFIEQTGSIGEREMEGIRLHIETLKLIVAKDLKGDGGELGQQVIVGLQQMVDKLSAGA